MLSNRITPNGLKMKHKILIIEDHKDISMLISMLIGRELKNAQVDVGESVETAIAQLKKKKYGLIILDHFIPGGNATKVLDFIKDVRGYKRSVIYYSAHPLTILKGDILFEEKYRELFKCVIEKPDTDLLLLKEIHKHFHPKKQFSPSSFDNKSLKEISNEANIDPRKAGRIVRKMHGKSFSEISRMMKLRKTKRLLDLNLTTKQTASEIGMHEKKLPAFFKRETGITPTQYKKRKKEPVK